MINSLLLASHSKHICPDSMVSEKVLGAKTSFKQSFRKTSQNY